MPVWSVLSLLTSAYAVNNTLLQFFFESFSYVEGVFSTLFVKYWFFSLRRFEDKRSQLHLSQTFSTASLVSMPAGRLCNALMMVTTVIETFAICHLYLFLWPCFSLQGFSALPLFVYQISHALYGKSPSLKGLDIFEIRSSIAQLTFSNNFSEHGLLRIRGIQ